MIIEIQSMKKRRDFIKKIGLMSAMTAGFPAILSGADTSQSNSTIKGLTFLFQGDSITDGNRGRNNDWNHVLGHGYAYLIASRLWFDHTDKDLMFYNRGISGNTVNDLLARWQQDTLDLKPDVLSILIGINDVLAVIKNDTPDFGREIEESYRKILRLTKEKLPGTTIVLCEPFILPVGRVKEAPDAWQQKVSQVQVISRKLSKEFNTLFVELQKPFDDACHKAPPTYWMWDGIHPMPAGHELIARTWIAEVSKQFDFMKHSE